MDESDVNLLGDATARLPLRGQPSEFISVTHEARE